MARRPRFRAWIPSLESGLVSFLFEALVVLSLGSVSVVIAAFALLVL